MKMQECEVRYQIPLAENYFRLGLESGELDFFPGQFAMLAVPRLEGVLLRRPFSLARQLGEISEILYKVVGKGTRALSQVGIGQSLNLLAPLGQGFSQARGEGDCVAVAGGYGVAPFWELAFRLRQQGKKLQLYYGARTKGDLLYLEQFRELGVSLHLSTEDGSVGHHGRITELLAQNYAELRPAMVWSCGPMGLLASVQQWADQRRVPCELSVEEAMGCGTGICLACVVRDKEGNYVRACKEGPVFPGEKICL